MTFAPNNIHFVEKAIINLINESYTIISCNCIFEKGWNYSHAQVFYSELKKIADYLIFNNLYNKIGIRLFDENYYQPMLETDNNNWCGGVDMQSMAFDYCGNIYPCVRYMESSLNKR